MGREALGGEPGRERQREVDRAPAPRVQLQGGVGVLGHRLYLEAADRLDRGAAQHGARAAEEGRVPEVVAGLDHVVEEGLLGSDPALQVQVALEGVGVEEVLGGLDERDTRVLEESDRLAQEAPHRHVIGVEDRDQVAMGPRQRVVEVAGLGVRVVGARQVEAAQLARQGFEGLTAAVVEEEHLLARVVDGERPDQRAPHDRERLVIRGDEDVHAGKALQRRRGPALERDRLEVAEEEDQHAVDLGAQQQDRDRPVERAVEVQRRR